MPSYNLRYKRDKLRSKNFIPTIQFFLEEEKYPEEIYVPPIGEYVHREVEVKDEVEVEVGSVKNTVLELHILLKQLKNIKSVRRLELWIQQRRKEIRELNDSDMAELLEFVNIKYYTKKVKKPRPKPKPVVEDREEIIEEKLKRD